MVCVVVGVRAFIDGVATVPSDPSDPTREQQRHGELTGGLDRGGLIVHVVDADGGVLWDEDRVAAAEFVVIVQRRAIREDRGAA
jgi:hypothetical protein